MPKQKAPRFAGLFNRGAEIRTRDLTDPNGARYQAAPRPEEPQVSHTSRSPKAHPALRSPGARPRRRPDAEADRLLEPGHFEDYCVNGLQVPGPQSVETIATGVSAHVELFELAAQTQAQLLIVHHGLFWGPA